ncbi:ArsR/SmtB family transcription factor [Paenibacillus wynnii]|uniref:ArsR/SmtB family transcription factor n=1 Tax=Paenibacillus wynnii TaxID=268407 RepID=UPI0027923761|nr:metalloregulator ArsR/SmtB family transcription factor [Paenibacillus wynnii]MDQ0192789.1 DNA-binding transcriptional ArsR family regulator [Paenibacillus wynnii]
MEIKQMAKIFKALSNENRLELFLKIAESHETSIEASGGLCVADIASCLNIGAPTISHHIKELANAELVVTEKKGKFLLCKVNKDLISKITEMLAMEKKETI